MRSLLTPTLAVAALTSAQVAQAQEICVEPADLEDAITYAMPIAYDAVMQSCDTRYSQDSFMRSGGLSFTNQFRDKQDAAWPGAFALIQVFMAREAGAESEQATSALFESLPEEALRPFIDGIVQQGVMQEVKPDTCGDIEHALELLAPLPVENFSGILSFIAQMADLDNPPICSTTAK